MNLAAVSNFADATATRASLATFLQPTVIALSALALVVAVGVVVHSSIKMSTSAGNPSKLAEAKEGLKKAVTGLIIVLLSATLLNVLINSYASTSQSGVSIQTPIVRTIPAPTNDSIVDVIVNSVLTLIRTAIDQSYGFTFSVITQLINRTPLMSSIPAVFNLWIGVLGLADALLILVIILIGFGVMTGSIFGDGEVSLKRLAPKLAVGFIVMNSSIFLIDALISLANTMTDVIETVFKHDTVFDTLTAVLTTSGNLQLFALIIMFVFVILTVILCVYYLLRLIVLFVGAALSPLFVVLYLIPPFKEFAITAARTYVTTIFILFVHIIILTLASSLFISMSSSLTGPTTNPILAGLLGIATMMSILKVQHTANQLSFVSSGMNNARRMGTMLTRGIGSVWRRSNQSSAPAAKAGNVVTVTRIVE